MKNLLFVAMLAALAGCTAETSSVPRSTDAASESPSEASYSEALDVYKTELDILNDLRQKKVDYESIVAEQVSEQDEFVRQSTEGLSPAFASEVREELGAMHRESRKKMAKEREEYFAEIDTKIAEQEPKVDRAKAALDEVESRLDRPSSRSE